MSRPANLVDFITQNVGEFVETSYENKQEKSSPFPKHLPHQSPSFRSLQNGQTVSFSIFESTIGKLQSQISNLELHFEVINTLRDQYIQLEGRIENLEQLVHMDKNLFQLRHFYQSNNIDEHNFHSNIQSQQKQVTPPLSPRQRDQHRRQSGYQVEELQATNFRQTQTYVHEELDVLRRELKREVGDKFQDVERYIHRFLSQAKEIDEKVTLLQDKHKQNTEVIAQNQVHTNQLVRQIEKFKEEINEKTTLFNSRNKAVVITSQSTEVYEKSIEEVRSQITKTDAEILKIFKQIKKLLDIDWITNKLQGDVELIKRVQNEQRVALKEIQKALNGYQHYII